MKIRRTKTGMEEFFAKIKTRSDTCFDTPSECLKRSKRSTSGSILLASLCTALTAIPVYADELLDLPLTELLSLEVTSVSKKPQTISQAAAAISVITGDDIRRTGARTIADALRSVPGIQVAQISANSWAVSSRGVDGRFTNKLLVLMDGRSIYSSFSSGVFWDIQDTVLEDIDRIEVIRGPGAALWGSNAVNGVINIITKSSASTQGTLVEATSGSKEPGEAALRHGGTLGAIGTWRAYAKGFKRDGSTIGDTGNINSNRNGDDAWHQTRAGFRSDLAPTAKDALTIQGDYYKGKSGETAVLNFLTAPYNTWQATTQQLSGGNVLARWQHDVSSSDTFTVQSYFDQAERDFPAHWSDRRSTIEIDTQYRTRAWKHNDWVFGFQVRRIDAAVKQSNTGLPTGVLPYLDLDSQNNATTMTSWLLQDDITLKPSLLTLTIGAKIESGGYSSGTKVQPNIRLLATPYATTTAWASVARAARTANQQERDVRGIYAGDVMPPDSQSNPLVALKAINMPLVVKVSGYTETEWVTAFETGLKQRFSPTLSGDIALYYNKYDHLRLYERNALVCPPSLVGVLAAYNVSCSAGSATQNYFFIPVTATNNGSGYSHGVELSMEWRAHSDLRYILAYSNQRFTADLPNENFRTPDEPGTAPQYQINLRQSWNPVRNVDIDLMLRRVDGLSMPTKQYSTPAPVIGVRIPAYNELDAHFAWRPSKNVEWALIGRNLLHNHHAEFASELTDTPIMRISRSIVGQLVWRF